MFLLEMALERPNLLKATIFAPKSIFLPIDINKLRGQKSAITTLN
jgi:hypothetical protein